jgi:hypothetical protein
MIRNIAKEFPGNIKSSKNNNFPKIMKLCHCVDQHWAPDFVYFFSIPTILEFQVLRILNFRVSKFSEKIIYWIFQFRFVYFEFS